MYYKMNTSLLMAAVCHLGSAQHTGKEAVDQTNSTKDTGLILWQYFLNKTLSAQGMD
jgi:hypothetical protein